MPLNDSAVILDCDPGWDDAMALAFVLESKSADVVGVTTVFGNGPLNETTENACRMTALCERPDVIVYPGCNTPLNGGRVDFSGAPRSAVLEAVPANGPVGLRHGSDFIIHAAQEYENELTIIASGPLTNLATALTRDQDFSSRVSNVVIMGGALSAGNITSYAEYNFFLDAEAARVTLNSKLRKVIVPLETCAQLPLTVQFTNDICSIGTEVANVLGGIAAERLRASGPANAVPLYDVLAVLFALHPEIFQVEYGKLDVVTQGSRRGALSFTREREPSHSGVATYIDAPSGYSFLLEFLSKARR